MFRDPRWYLASLMLVYLGLVIPVQAANTCSIVYGVDWAFLSNTPSGWQSTCGDQGMKGTAITLWPYRTGTTEPAAIMYVTVSARNPRGVEAFARDELADFEKANPSSHASLQSSLSSRAGKKYVVASFSNAPGKREELAAYLEGPTADYVIVLTAVSRKSLAAYRQTFFNYVQHFVAMERN